MARALSLSLLKSHSSSQELKCPAWEVPPPRRGCPATAKYSKDKVDPGMYLAVQGSGISTGHRTKAVFDLFPILP